MDDLQAKLERLRDRGCFLPPGTKSLIEHIALVEGDKGTIKVFRESINDEDTFNSSQALVSQSSTVAHIYVLSQTHSFGRLQVTESLFESLVRRHQFTSRLLTLVSGFHEKLYDLEGAWNPPFVHSRTNKVLEYGYVLKYAELNGRTNLEPWSLRQTTIFHQYDLATKCSAYVLVDPVPDSSSSKGIIDLFCASRTSIEASTLHLQTHHLLLNCYLDNWRGYMCFYEQRLDDLAHQPLAPGSVEHSTITSSDLGSLQFLEGRFTPLVASFASSLRIIARLRTIMADDATFRASQMAIDGEPCFLAHAEAALLGYKDNVDALLSRCSSASALMNNTLNLRHQAITMRQSLLVMSLTKSAVDDSTTVRAITIITLTYLSFALVASVYSMPFFALDDNGSLRTSSDLWKYLAVSIPLTLCSLGTWRLMLVFKRKRQRQLEDIELKKLV